jgi:hypothetical protein
MHFGKQNDVDKFLGCEIQGEKTWSDQDAMGNFQECSEKMPHD